MIKYFCDVCGTEIPIAKKKIPFTDEYVEMLDAGKLECKQINSFHLNNYLYSNTHMCKQCAEKTSLQIDNEILNLKLNLLNK